MQLFGVIDNFSCLHQGKFKVQMLQVTVKALLIMKDFYNILSTKTQVVLLFLVLLLPGRLLSQL